MFIVSHCLRNVFWIGMRRLGFFPTLDNVLARCQVGKLETILLTAEMFFLSAAKSVQEKESCNRYHTKHHYL